MFNKFILTAAIVFFVARLNAITVNPASMVTADSQATAFTIPYRDSNGQFEILNATFTGTGVIYSSGTATGIGLQQPQAGGNINIIYRDNTGAPIFSLLWDSVNARWAVRDSANGANRFTVMQAGNVGVGTGGSPVEKLHISSGTILIDGNGTAPTAGGALCINTSRKIVKCTSVVDVSGNCTCP